MTSTYFLVPISVSLQIKSRTTPMVYDVTEWHIHQHNKLNSCNAIMIYKGVEHCIFKIVEGEAEIDGCICPIDEWCTATNELDTMITTPNCCTVVVQNTGRHVGQCMDRFTVALRELVLSSLCTHCCCLVATESPRVFHTLVHYWRRMGYVVVEGSLHAQSDVGTPTNTIGVNPIYLQYRPRNHTDWVPRYTSITDIGNVIQSIWRSDVHTVVVIWCFPTRYALRPNELLTPLSISHLITDNVHLLRHGVVRRIPCSPSSFNTREIRIPPVDEVSVRNPVTTRGLNNAFPKRVLHKYVTTIIYSVHLPPHTALPTNQTDWYTRPYRVADITDSDTTTEDMIGLVCYPQPIRSSTDPRRWPLCVLYDVHNNEVIWRSTNCSSCSQPDIQYATFAMS